MNGTCGNAPMSCTSQTWGSLSDGQGVRHHPMIEVLPAELV
jgi:hypothetical protein